MKKRWKNLNIIWKNIKYYTWRMKIHLQRRWIKVIEWCSKWNFHLKFLFFWFLFSIAILSIIYILYPEFYVFYLSLSYEKSNAGNYFEIFKQLIWLVSAVVSYLGLSITLDLAIWGRNIQHKSHLQERYEKAAEMLGNHFMAVRIAGCIALTNLGKENKNMKVQCVHLLFAFINNPYLNPKYQGVNLNRVFSFDEPLRPDIQEAIDGFCFIYNHYGNKVVDKGHKLVKLPPYFWKNRHKGRILLIKANLYKTNSRGAYLSLANLQGADLWGANLQEADLWGANLQEADLRLAKLQGAVFFEAELQGASFVQAKMQGVNLFYSNLQGAKLSGADITNAEMEKAINLTKNQILSAIWGLDEEGIGNAPLLPDEVYNDPDILKWSRTPHYNKKEEEEKRQERLKNNS